MSVPPADAADESRRSSRPASNASSTTSSNNYPSHPPEDEYIPDEFFDDFENNDFLEGLVEKSDDEDNDDADNDTGRRHRSTERSSSPVVQNCLKEIDKLTQDIRRRKRMLERELSAAGGSLSRDRRSSRRRTRSRSPVSSSEYRRQSSIHQRQLQQRSNRSPARSRSRDRELRRRMDARRARHASQSPPPSRNRTSGGSRPSAGMSFLDELTHTFAKQGKQFPEKDLLLRQQQLRDNGQNSAAKRTRLTSPPASMRPRTTLLNTPEMMHPMQPMNAMPLAHGMLPNPAYQQQPHQLYQQPYSNLMAAANAIVPPPQSMPLLSQPGYANAYDTGNHAYGSPIAQNSLLPTPMMNMSMPLAEPMAITIIPDLSPDSTVPPPSLRVKARALQQSKSAIRLLRRADNQIPKTQFIFTSTTFVLADDPDQRRNNTNTEPICSPKNATFALTNNTTAVPAACHAAMRSTNLGTTRGQLPGRLQRITTVLGFSSGALDAATRIKTQANRVYDTLVKPADLNMVSESTVKPTPLPQDTLPPRSRTADLYSPMHMPTQSMAPIPQPVPAPPPPAVQMRSMHVQTGPPDPCAECCARAAIKSHTLACQTEAPPKTASVRTQTVETPTKTNGATPAPPDSGATFALPLQQSLSKMTAGQLVAMTDFARIINDPRPANSVELFTLREQLMDVYNLSQRDDEQVRTAERDKLNSVRNLLAEKTATLASTAMQPQPTQKQQPPKQQQQPQKHTQAQKQPQSQQQPHGHSYDWLEHSYEYQTLDWRWQQQQQHAQHERFPGGPSPWGDGAMRPPWPHPGGMRGGFWPPRGRGRGRGGF